MILRLGTCRASWRRRAAPWRRWSRRASRRSTRSRRAISSRRGSRDARRRGTGCSQIGLSSLFMAAKNGSNSGRSSGLPPTLEKICAPMAPRSLMARSTSRGAGIARRQRCLGDEGREVLGVLGDELGQAVVGKPRQLQRNLGIALAHRFQRRHRDGQDLRIVGELLDHAAARVEIVDRLHGARPPEHVLEAGADLFHALVVFGRVEMRESIDTHGVSPRLQHSARNASRAPGFRKWRGRPCPAGIAGAASGSGSSA